ncbi:MAG: GreA/GreB family elongation factor [Myxococcales bacterium]|nr:GreA/GreB family elongation factor [Myxococcales bacterium]
MSAPPSKRRIVDLAISRLEADLAAAQAQAEATRRDATHEEARPENDKDTRGLEQSYLARGHAQRVEDLRDAIATLRFLDLPAFGPDAPVVAGALVLVEVAADDATHLEWWLVTPVAGGLTIEVDGVEVRLITPTSPVGRALLEKVEGDEFEVRVAGRVREYVIESVR